MLPKNSLHEVTFTDLNNLGCGVCHIDGMAVFADGACDGDTAVIRIIKNAQSYAVAKIESLITPSSHRITPDCPVSKRCGGCIYRHISYEHECELKQNYVAQAFRKAGVEADIAPLVPSPQTDFYRNKAEIPVSPDGTMGFYARHSHDIVPCDTCRLGSPAFDAIAAAFKSWYQSHPRAAVRHLYLRRNTIGQVLVCLVTAEKSVPAPEELIQAIRNACPQTVGVLLNYHPEESNVILGKTCTTLWGQAFLEDSLRGVTFRIHPLSFYQVNRDAAEGLYGQVINRLRDCGAKSLLDLYCGAGTIGLCVARELPGLSLTGIEIVPEAVENARENAARNGITNASFLCRDAAEVDISGFDAIVTDPPRKGMAKELVDRLLREGPRYIVYVSCNPDTMARDVKCLTEGGYTPGQVTPVDMFPRTGAVEAVCLLSRS